MSRPLSKWRMRPLSIKVQTFQVPVSSEKNVAEYPGYFGNRDPSVGKIIKVSRKQMLMGQRSVLGGAGAATPSQIKFLSLI